VQSQWDSLARTEDLFGVIWGYPRLPNQSLPAFLRSGDKEIAATLRSARLRRLPRRHDAALDFGCGAGRLTQAMARRFERAVGVDVSPAMIEAAIRLDRGPRKCEFLLNEAPSLERFGDASFDFVYSNVVLQHMPPELGVIYVGELARVLRPGGLLVFQVPDERIPLPPLRRSAFVARIEPAEERLRIPAGADALVHVRVRNESRARWPAASGPQMIYLGNHWLAEDGALLVLDDGRVGLGRDVDPGAELELELPVRAPEAPGRYQLELDLVQQDVCWFSNRRRLSRRRTRTVRVPVEAGAAHEPAQVDPAARDGSPGPGGMEMHAIPRGEVVAALERGGAQVLRVREDHAAGLGWRSLRYTATKLT
jgi:SAM-dependent methyltransferase